MFVGSLGPREKLYRNDGAFVFTSVSTQITALSDSTLDCTVADLDNDGRYDLVTAQGESNTAQFANKVYLDVGGPADTLPPVVTALRSPPSADAAGPVVVHAKVRDQVLDDGVDYLTASARSVVLATPVSVNVALTPAGFSPPLSNIAPGTSVVFANNSGTTQTIACATSPYDWSVNLAAGQLYEHFFVAAASYTVSASPGGSNASIVVGGGGVTTAKGLKAGVGQYRFSLPNPLGPGATRLVYELEFEDWAGNRSVTSNGVVALLDCNLATYCTSKPSSLPACVPTISASGTPSASAGSGFLLQAGPLPGAGVGLFVYTTNGAAQSPVQNAYGWLCLQTGTGLFRISTQPTGGNPGTCNGQMAIDFNQYYSVQVMDPRLVPGARVDIQAWYRDPPSAGGANLTEAGRFYMCP